MPFGSSSRGLFPPLFFYLFLNDPRGDVIVFCKKNIPSRPPPSGGNSENITVYIWSSHIARVMINRVGLSILLVVS